MAVTLPGNLRGIDGAFSAPFDGWLHLFVSAFKGRLGGVSGRPVRG
ncbi:hypothetical protein [Pseudooceanicola algae]|nr:hypothetical protein [Pseudooceanicola algae]